MMIIKKFEDCIAYQKAGELTLEIYKLFRSNKDFGFKDQIQRASVSIMNNIAEGLGRNSDREKKQFLNIASGSCSEVKSMLYLSVRLTYIPEKDYKILMALTEETSKTLSGLRKSIK